MNKTKELSAEQEILQNYNGVPNTLNIPLIIELFSAKYASVNTRDSKISAFKKQLLLKTTVPNYQNGHIYNITMKKQGLQPILIKPLDTLQISKEDRDIVFKQQAESHEQSIQYEKCIPKECVDKLIKLIGSKNLYEIYISLLIITGRRSSEINASGKLRKSKGRLLFTGKLKNELEKSNEYEIQSLIPIEKTISAFNRFKKLLGDQDPVLFSGRALKYLKNQLKIDIKLHDLRGIYISYFYQYLNKGGLSKNYLVKTLLLHSDLKQISNYSRFIIN